MSTFLESIAVSVNPQKIVPLSAPLREPEGRAVRFVKGPIPAEWLEQAARLSGKALHAALAIRYLDGFRGTGTVQLRPSTRNSYGMDRFSCNRALDQLKAAGLITVLRKAGAAPVVTIMAANTQ